MDIMDIREVLPHRYPFLMVDRIIELEKGKRAVGIKNVTINEPHFTGHYPDMPIMPGVLILEAMAQVGGLAVSVDGDDKSIVPFLVGIDKVRFRKMVTPGDQLRIESEITKARAGIMKIVSKAYVGDALAAEGELMFALKRDKEAE